MTQTLLSELTTAAVGGPAGTFVEARTEAEIIDAVRSADAEVASQWSTYGSPVVSSVAAMKAQVFS